MIQTNLEQRTVVGWCQDSTLFVRDLARKSANKVQGLDMQDPINHMATTWLNPENLVSAP